MIILASDPGKCGSVIYRTRDSLISLICWEFKKDKKYWVYHTDYSGKMWSITLPNSYELYRYVEQTCPSNQPELVVVEGTYNGRMDRSMIVLHTHTGRLLQSLPWMVTHRPTAMEWRSSCLFPKLKDLPKGKRLSGKDAGKAAIQVAWPQLSKLIDKSFDKLTWNLRETIAESWIIGEYGLRLTGVKDFH